MDDLTLEYPDPFGGDPQDIEKAENITYAAPETERYLLDEPSENRKLPDEAPKFDRPPSPEQLNSQIEMMLNTDINNIRRNLHHQ